MRKKRRKGKEIRNHRRSESGTEVHTQMKENFNSKLKTSVGFALIGGAWENQMRR